MVLGIRVKVGIIAVRDDKAKRSNTHHPMLKGGSTSILSIHVRMTVHTKHVRWRELFQWMRTTPFLPVPPLTQRFRLQLFTSNHFNVRGQCSVRRVLCWHCSVGQTRPIRAQAESAVGLGSNVFVIATHNTEKKRFFFIFDKRVISPKLLLLWQREHIYIGHQSDSSETSKSTISPWISRHEISR